MSESLLMALATVAINGAVTWGVVSTKLAWMRRDLDAHDSRITYLERQA
ncbi:hypothetical protein ACQ86G_21540 [Roseateles chitinivorans]